MSETLLHSFLALSVLWPLLLALPAIQKRVHWSLYLALLPSVCVVVLPLEISLSLPSVLMGSGLALDHSNRWILLASLIGWFFVMRFESRSGNPALSARNTLLLLALSGNLGVILSTELIGFFSFSTLMGYAYFGLLLENGNEHVKSFAQRYLVLLISADLLLFEALLLASFSTENLQFGFVQHVMSKAESANFYLLLVLCGFALKSGIWPAQFWLQAQYQSSLPANRLLVSLIPLSIAMLGAIRWLPLGEQAAAESGMLLQVAGTMTLLYALFRLYAPFNLPRVSGWISVASISLLCIALGSAFSDPLIWCEYANASTSLIAVTLLLLMLLSLAGARQPSISTTTTSLTQSASSWKNQLRTFSVGRLRLLSNRRSLLFNVWLIHTHQLLSSAGKTLQFIHHLHIFNGWTGRMLLLVLIGLGFAWLSTGSMLSD
jgi:formate hydrogenlyase subunit 3/multisubunit Na+/H+ antiporter MnhD subunit